MSTYIPGVEKLPGPRARPAVLLVGGGARWATFVAAAGAVAEPRSEGADAAGAVLAAESSPCKVLVGEGARWATIVAAAGAPAAPWSEGADAAGAKLTAESSPCNMLVGGGARWATNRRCIGGFCRALVTPGGYDKNRCETGVGDGWKNPVDQDGARRW